MADPFGRPVTNLRISVTDCFDFYSTYRMAENMSVPPKKNLLSLQKLHLQCSAFLAKTRAQAGIRTGRKGHLPTVDDRTVSDNDRPSSLRGHPRHLQSAARSDTADPCRFAADQLYDRSHLAKSCHSGRRDNVKRSPAQRRGEFEGSRRRWGQTRLHYNQARDRMFPGSSLFSSEVLVQQHRRLQVESSTDRQKCWNGHSVLATFIFSHLLKRNAEGIRDVRLAQPKSFASRPDPFSKSVVDFGIASPSIRRLHQSIHRP